MLPEGIEHPDLPLAAVETSYASNMPRYRKLSDDLVVKMISVFLNENEVSLEKIGARFGVSGSAVSYIMRTRGVKARGLSCKTRRLARATGSAHHNWRGGRKIVYGYVMVKANGHPCAQRNGYIYEHRLVMERWLRDHKPWHPALDATGHLRRDWEVHHRDERRDNNAIENLVPALSPAHAKHHRLAKRDRAELLARIVELEAMTLLTDPAR